MKKKTAHINTPKCESKKLDSMPQKQDHVSEYLEKLFGQVKAKVEAIKAAGTTNACNIPLHDMSASTPDKACSLEKTTGNRERDCLRDLPIISQGAEVTAEANPLLVRNREYIKELSSCKAILKEYADKINIENPNYETKKVNGSNLAFVSSLTFNGKQYVGDEGRNKKESQHLAARVVILSILDSDAREVISKIIKSKEKMLCPAKGKVHNPCSTQNVGMSAGIQTGCDVGTSSSKGNELKVVVNDKMLETATQDPCTGNLFGVSAKHVSLVEGLEDPSFCKVILKQYADKINVKKPIYETKKANGSAFFSYLTFNGKQYVGDKGRSKKESQNLAARAVIRSILDSDAREVISKIIKSREKMLFHAKGKVHNPCSAQNVGMSAGIQTGCDVGTSSSKGNELKVVVNDKMLETATHDPCTGNLFGVSAKPVSLVEGLEDLSFCKVILKEYADKINVKNPDYETEKADGSHLAFFSSLTFNGKQYVGDKGRSKKESQNLAARAVIRSILDSDAHDVITKIIMSKDKMLCPAKGKVHNPCNAQNVGFPVGIQTGYNVGTCSRKGNELEVVVNDNMLKRASQEPCTGNSSSVTEKSVSLLEASATTTLIVPPNSEPLLVGSTTSKKRKRKTKKAEHKVGIDAQVQIAAVPSRQTITSTDYSDRICATNNCVSLPGSDIAVLTS